MTPSDELADRIDYNLAPRGEDRKERSTRRRDDRSRDPLPPWNRKRAFSPSLSLFFFSRHGPIVPRFSDQFAAINARGPRGPTSRTHARELSAARGRNRESTVPPVTDNLTPGLNGLLAHNIGRPRQDTGHYNMEMTGTHRPPSIGHRAPGAANFCHFNTPGSPCDKQGEEGGASYAATSNQHRWSIYYWRLDPPFLVNSNNSPLFSFRVETF